MHDPPALDGFDRRLLAALQRDASRSNQALADLVGLSASQVSRRRARLEEAGVIRRYRAEIDGRRLGLGVLAFVQVRLSTHNPDNARRFRELVRTVPEIQESHALTGDMDYLVKVAVADLAALAGLVNDVLLPHESVAHVRSSIALETLKDTNELPIPLR